MYKRKLVSVTFFVLLVILFSVGCSNKTAHQTNLSTLSKFTVNFINSSDALISEIQYEGGGMINANGSLLEKKDTFQLDFDYPKKSLLISILDDEKEILFAKTISLEFNSQNIANLKIINVSDGIDLINSK